MKTIACFLAAAGLFVSGAAGAQEDYQVYRPQRAILNLNYQVGLPIGGTSDYVGRASWLGFGFESRAKVRPDLSAGFAVAWNRFDETFNPLTVTTGNTTINGPTYRYLDYFSARATGHYYFVNSSRVEPYLGIGLGIAWSYRYQQVADLGITNTRTDFIMTPELGMMYTIQPGLAFDLRFGYTFTTIDLPQTSNAQFLNFIGGFSWWY